MTDWDERLCNVTYVENIQKENEANARKIKDLQRKNADLKNQNDITEEVNRDMSEELQNLKQILEHERRLRNRLSHFAGFYALVGDPPTVRSEF